jgi:four helix bundle protein
MNKYNKEQRTKNIGKVASFRSYKDLIVYQKAKESTLGLVKYYSDKKLNWTEKYLVDQLIRSAASIGANLAEGYGRLYRQDYRRFVSISRGSSFELDYWGELLSEIRPEDKQFLSGINESNLEVIKMSTTLMKKLEI